MALGKHFAARGTGKRITLRAGCGPGKRCAPAAQRSARL